MNIELNFSILKTTLKPVTDRPTRRYYAPPPQLAPPNQTIVIDFIANPTNFSRKLT